MVSPTAPSGAERLAERIVERILDRPRRALALLVAALGAAFLAYAWRVDWRLGHVPTDNRVEVWFTERDPALATYRRFTAAFGNDEVVLLALRDPSGVFTPSTLTLVAEVSSRLAVVPGVEGVTSLATVLHVGDDEAGTLVVDRLYEGAVANDAQALRVRARLHDSPAHRASLVSPDETTTLLTVRLSPWSQDEKAERARVHEALRAVVGDALERAGRRRDGFRMGGVGVINIALDTLSKVDSGRFLALGGVVMLVCLWIALRRLLAVAIAVASIYVAILLTIGLYLGAGLKLNLITSILPTLVLAIGLTDCVFFITTYTQERAALEATLGRRGAIARALGHCVLPGLFNSVTSAFGFLAFLGAKLAILQWFGLFAGVGIALAFVSALVCCALAFQRFELRPAVRAHDGPSLDRLLAWLTALVERRRRAILAVTAALAVVCAVGVARLKVDQHTIDYFHPDHPVRVASEGIEREFGPFVPLDVVVDTGEEAGAHRPDVLAAIDAIEAERAAHERRLGGSISIVAVVKLLHRGFAGPQASGAGLPTDRALVDQELLFYDPANDDDPLRLVDFSQRTARLGFRVASVSAAEAADVIAGIEASAAERLPAGVTLSPTGRMLLYVKQVEHILHGQVVSLLLTILLTSLFTGLFFRDWRYALLALPSNLVPVFMTLAFMGYAGIRLDGATVLVGSITIGIAVDDTIHFLFSFRDALRRTGDVPTAVRETVRSIGLAIVVTSVVMALGFGVFLFASFKTMATFGALSMVTMLSAIVGELLVTPALLLTFGKRLFA